MLFQLSSYFKVEVTVLKKIVLLHQKNSFQSKFPTTNEYSGVIGVFYWLV